MKKTYTGSEIISLYALNSLAKIEKHVDDSLKFDVEFVRSIIKKQQEEITRLQGEAKPQEQTAVEEEAIIFNGKKYPGMNLADVIKLNETEEENNEKE